MYLLPAGTSTRSTTKWRFSGLAGFSSRAAQGRPWGLGNVHTRLPRSRGMSYFTKKGSLGQDSPDCPGAVIDPITGELCANLPPLAPAPQQPGVDPAVQQAYKNLLTQQQNSQNPLDYVSPQAAIAAGLNPQIVYTAWSQALARFPTQQAALQAGIPAGVVTQLYAASRSALPSTGFLDQAPLCIANKFLLMGGFGIALLAGMRGGRRR